MSQNRMPLREAQKDYMQVYTTDVLKDYVQVYTTDVLKHYVQVYTTECKKTTYKSTPKDGKIRHTSLHHLNGKHIQHYTNTIVKQAENASAQCKSVYLSTGIQG